MNNKALLFNKMMFLAGISYDRLVIESNLPLCNLINYKCAILKNLVKTFRENHAIESNKQKSHNRRKKTKDSSITCISSLAKETGYAIDWLKPLDDAAGYLTDLLRKELPLLEEYADLIDQLSFEYIYEKLGCKSGVEKQTMHRLSAGTRKKDLVKYKFLYQYVFPYLEGFREALLEYVTVNTSIFAIPAHNPFAKEISDSLKNAKSNEELGHYLIQLLIYHERLDTIARINKEEQKRNLATADNSSTSIAISIPHFHKHAHDYIDKHIPLIKEVILPERDIYAAEMYAVICKTQEQYADLKQSCEDNFVIDGNIELIRILIANIHSNENIHSSFHSFVGASA